jgi:hypothetical protein
MPVLSIRSLKVTSLVSAPYVCESIAYRGISSPKSLVTLNLSSLLRSIRCIIQSISKGISGKGSSNIKAPSRDAYYLLSWSGG